MHFRGCREAEESRRLRVYRVQIGHESHDTSGFSYALIGYYIITLWLKEISITATSRILFDYLTQFRFCFVDKDKSIPVH